MDTDNTPQNLNGPPLAKNSKYKPKIFILVGLFILAGLGGLLFTRTRPESYRQPSTVTVPNEVEESEVEINITKDGFVPSAIIISKGTKVTWVNTDTGPHRIASNPYPDHTELPSLDSKEALGPETTYTYTFNETGTFGYHDHYQPTTNGTVVVE